MILEWYSRIEVARIKDINRSGAKTMIDIEKLSNEEKNDLINRLKVNFIFLAVAAIVFIGLGYYLIYFATLMKFLFSLLAVLFTLCLLFVFYLNLSTYLKLRRELNAEKINNN